MEISTLRLVSTSYDTQSRDMVRYSVSTLDPEKLH